MGSEFLFLALFPIAIHFAWIVHVRFPPGKRLLGWAITLPAIVGLGYWIRVEGLMHGFAFGLCMAYVFLFLPLAFLRWVIGLVRTPGQSGHRSFRLSR
jgi:hypothetical protein